MKKKINLLAVAFFLIGVTHAQSWVTLTSGTTNDLYAVHFPTESVGFAVGADGTILKTTDGGSTWNSTTSSFAGYSFWDVHFENEYLGYVGGESYAGLMPSGNGIMLKTTDGGTTWTTIWTTTSTMPIRDIFVVDENIVFGCGSSESATDGSVIRSIDGGATWQQTYFGMNAMALGGMYYFDENNGFLGIYYDPGVPYHGTNWSHTSDGVNYSFSLVDASSSYWYFRSDFPTSSVGYMTRSTYLSDSMTYLRKTTDGGSTWTEHILDSVISTNNIDFINADTGYLVGSNNIDMGYIKKTVDGGANWTTDYTLSDYTISGICFVNSNLGFAVGGNGTIVKFGEQTNPNRIFDMNDDNKQVLEIYPNPTSTVVTINETINFNDISILNILGQNMMVKIINNNKIDVSGFAKGIYFIQLKKENNVKTGKLIVD